MALSIVLWRSQGSRKKVRNARFCGQKSHPLRLRLSPEVFSYRSISLSLSLSLSLFHLMRPLGAHQGTRGTQPLHRAQPTTGAATPRSGKVAVSSGRTAAAGMSLGLARALQVQLGRDRVLSETVLEARMAMGDVVEALDVGRQQTSCRTSRTSPIRRRVGAGSFWALGTLRPLSILCSCSRPLAQQASLSAW